MTQHDDERPTAGRIGSEWADVEYASGGLLGELDAKQDEVIQRLDELNVDIERLISQWQVSEAFDPDGRSETEAA